VGWSSPATLNAERGGFCCPQQGCANSPSAPACSGAATLSVVYLGVVSLAGGLSRALELFWEDRLFVVPILLGFGGQAALYTRLRLAARRARAEGAMTAAGGGLSTAGMIAFCAHHLCAHCAD